MRSCRIEFANEGRCRFVVASQPSLNAPTVEPRFAMIAGRSVAASEGLIVPKPVQIALEPLTRVSAFIVQQFGTV